MLDIDLGMSFFMPPRDLSQDAEMESHFEMTLGSGSRSMNKAPFALKASSVVCLRTASRL